MVRYRLFSTLGWKSNQSNCNRTDRSERDNTTALPRKYQSNPIQYVVVDTFPGRRRRLLILSIFYTHLPYPSRLLRPIRNNNNLKMDSTASSSSTDSASWPHQTDCETKCANCDRGVIVDGTALRENGRLFCNQDCYWVCFHFYT